MLTLIRLALAMGCTVGGLLGGLVLLFTHSPGHAIGCTVTLCGLSSLILAGIDA